MSAAIDPSQNSQDRDADTSAPTNIAIEIEMKEKRKKCQLNLMIFRTPWYLLLMVSMILLSLVSIDKERSRLQMHLREPSDQCLGS